MSASLNKPDVTINDRQLTIAEKLTLHVALNSFLADMQRPDALGTDPTGAAISKGYKLACHSMLESITADDRPDQDDVQERVTERLVRIPAHKVTHMENEIINLRMILEQLRARNQRLAAAHNSIRDALVKIAAWTGFPEAKDHQGNPCSYGAAYGSNGERDFMRDVAQRALNHTVLDSAATDPS